ECRELREPLRRLDLRDRGGQRGLAMVDVTDGPDVDVGLVTDEFLFRHCDSSSGPGPCAVLLSEPSPRIELGTPSLPRKCTATVLRGRTKTFWVLVTESLSGRRDSNPRQPA